VINLSEITAKVQILMQCFDFFYRLNDAAKRRALARPTSADWLGQIVLSQGLTSSLLPIE
jgi:hypothetical protein